MGQKNRELWEIAQDMLRLEFERNCHPHRHRAKSLRATFRFGPNSISGDNMTVSMTANESVKGTVAPVKSDGTPSLAKLSNLVFTSSDPTVFTVAADPATPNGFIITGVKAGTATHTYKALATEPDGTTTETIQGVDTIVLAAAPQPAAALVATYGTPFVTAPPPPPPPPPPTV